MSHLPSTSPRRVPAGRAARLGRLGAMATGIAGNVLASGLRSAARGERPEFRRLLLTPANATRMADDLARMRGAAMKLGQLLSMEASDVLPPELATILSRLQAGADPMPPRDLKARLTGAWGADWLRQFAAFDPRPIAAASIGQVHRATLRDGRIVAVKVQYPGVARSIDSDVDTLAALIRVSGLLPRGFDMDPYLLEARQQLRLEADYLQEAAFLETYAVRLGQTERFEVPAVLRDWTTPDVLTLSFHDSQPIDRLADAPQALRDRVARDLIDLVLREIFEFGLIQSDPNFANFRYNPATGRIVLLDFGATRVIAPEIVAACRAALRAGLTGDGPSMEAALGRLGLLPHTMAPRHRAAVLSMIGTVLDAVRGGVVDFGSTELLARLRAEGRALADDRMPPPEVPMDLLYLQRKIGGIYLLASMLRARVPVRAVIEDHLRPGD